MYGLDGKTFQLLQESAGMMDSWSETTCAFKTKGGMEEWAKDANQVEPNAGEVTCDWYHGTWQQMRLLNMVAVPNWYHFYNEAIDAVFKEKPNAKVFISACADYGMLAKVHESIINTGAKPEIIIYDICQTPLNSCQWYADKFGLEIKCKTSNIIANEIPEAPFDLVVTDEFLSVLKKEYKPMITKKWKEILKPDGVLVTTGMIGKPTEKENREYFAEKANNLFKMYGKMIFPEEVAKNGESRLLKKFQRFADYHTRHMLVDEAELKELFKDFEFLKYDVLTTPGECVNPTDSFQIVAKVKKD